VLVISESSRRFDVLESVSEVVVPYTFNLRYLYCESSPIASAYCISQAPMFVLSLLSPRPSAPRSLSTVRVDSSVATTLLPPVTTRYAKFAQLLTLKLSLPFTIFVFSCNVTLHPVDRMLDVRVSQSLHHTQHLSKFAYVSAYLSVGRARHVRHRPSVLSLDGRQSVLTTVVCVTR
jgi:hypothetical protein